MKLWRPVGLKELALLFDTQMREFPPRLPEQPIFYPVTNFGYAAQIAREWNTREVDRVGYVTEFEVEDDYVAQFERQIVGGREHEELWVPAESLAEFNTHIAAPIGVVAAYFGEGFQGFVPEQFSLRGKSATEQFAALTKGLSYSSFDMSGEIAANAKAVFLNFPFWLRGCSVDGRSLTEGEQEAIDFVQKRWVLLNCGFGLPESQPGAN